MKSKQLAPKGYAAYLDSKELLDYQMISIFNQLSSVKQSEYISYLLKNTQPDNNYEIQGIEKYLCWEHLFI